MQASLQAPKTLADLDVLLGFTVDGGNPAPANESLEWFDSPQIFPMVFKWCGWISTIHCMDGRPKLPHGHPAEHFLN